MAHGAERHAAARFDEGTSANLFDANARHVAGELFDKDCVDIRSEHLFDLIQPIDFDLDMS